MSMRICVICGKGSMVGGSRKKTRGHYNPQPKHKRYPNLQKFITPEGKRILACTRCIKTFAKQSLTATAI